MQLKSPDFWATRGLFSTALLPLSWFYRGLGHFRQRFCTQVEIGVPVICVGNIALGGAGKTPFCLLLVELLEQQGLQAHVILRGYGGTTKTSRPVSKIDTSKTVGDEACLYALRCPTWVGGDRVKSATLAMDAGADVILMDDGLQNPGLKKDLSFLLIDAEAGLGNNRCFPAGPLRESLKQALLKSHAVVLTSASALNQTVELRSLIDRTRSVDIFESDFELNESSKNLLLGESVVAFSGIGRPQKFFKSLQTIHCTLAFSKSFGDHHVFSDPELDALWEIANSNRSLLVTTEKDHVRLSDKWQKRVKLVRGYTKVRDPAKLKFLVNSIVPIRNLSESTESSGQ